jgi:hypothetical protein
MTRKELAAAARRRAIELLIADPKLSLHDAEVAAVRELKAIAKLQSREVDKLGQLATPSKAKPGGGARARLASVLEAISSRMSAARAVLPRGLFAPTLTSSTSGVSLANAQAGFLLAHFLERIYPRSPTSLKNIKLSRWPRNTRIFVIRGRRIAHL